LPGVAGRVTQHADGTAQVDQRAVADLADAAQRGRGIVRLVGQRLERHHTQDGDRRHR